MFNETSIFVNEVIVKFLVLDLWVMRAAYQISLIKLLNFDNGTFAIYFLLSIQTRSSTLKEYFIFGF